MRDFGQACCIFRQIGGLDKARSVVIDLETMRVTTEERQDFNNGGVPLLFGCNQ